MNAAAASMTRDSTPQPVLGVVKTTYPRLDVTQPAVNDAEFSGAAELDIWARRTFAANGFGDADVVLPHPVLADSTVDPHAGASPPRSASFWQICLAIGETLWGAVAGLAARWQQQREMRRTYEALSELDARTLKDIGFGSHEAGSIAAELAGRAERTRTQALRTLQFLTI